MKRSETCADCKSVNDGQDESGDSGRTNESNFDEHLF